MFGLLEWSLTKSEVEGSEIKMTFGLFPTVLNQIQSSEITPACSGKVNIFLFPNKTSFASVHIYGHNQETEEQHLTNLLSVYFLASETYFCALKAGKFKQQIV